MASFRRQGTRWEIRECRRTASGPRQFVLASFRGVLTPETLDQAQERAQRPFDRERLVAGARATGIPVTRRRGHPEARQLIRVLQRGGVPSPSLFALLRALLENLPSEPLPEHLMDAKDWLGLPETEHGRALRGLLRTGDRIAQARGPLRSRPHEVFPRFSSDTLEPVEG